MRRFQSRSMACIVALVPFAAHAQSGSSRGRDARWQPAVYAGAWTQANVERRPSEPVAGPIAAFEIRRRDPQRRVSVVATVSGYTKGGGLSTVDLPAPSRAYRVTGDMLTVGLGGDWAAVQGPTDWTIGLSVAAATSRSTTREISSTGLPYNRTGDDAGWGRATALLAARTGVTLPIAPTWGLRLGLEVLQGVGSLGDVQPMIGAHVGFVLRR